LRELLDWFTANRKAVQSGRASRLSLPPTYEPTPDTPAKLAAHAMLDRIAERLTVGDVRRKPNARPPSASVKPPGGRRRRWISLSQRWHQTMARQAKAYRRQRLAPQPVVSNEPRSLRSLMY
jgi:hypothetical protein